MGLFVGLAIVGIGFVVFMVVTWACGGFDAESYALKRERRERIINNIKQHATQINEDLDTLPSGSRIPFIGERARIKRRLKRMGVSW